MWFNIVFHQLVLNLLPIFLRMPVLMSYCQELESPLALLYGQWVQFRADNLYKIEHTGQVCYLRGSLNDKFDPMERRIYIGNGNAFNTTYIYTESEEQTVFLEDTIYLRMDEETADTGLDFIVFVPESIFNNQMHELNAHINFYRAAGRRYKIITI